MKLLQYLSLSIAVLGTLSIPVYSQENEENKSGEEAPMRKIETESEAERIVLDIHIDEDAIRREVQKSLADAQESLETTLGELEIQLERMEFDLRHMEMEIDRIDIPMPNMDFDAIMEDVDMDMDIDIDIDIDDEGEE